MSELIGREVQQHMGAAEAVAWGIAILCTCGLAYPAYRHRKNKLRRTTNIYA